MLSCVSEPVCTIGVGFWVLTFMLLLLAIMPKTLVFTALLLLHASLHARGVERGCEGDDDLDKQICFSVALPVLSALLADQTDISSLTTISDQLLQIGISRLQASQNR